MIAKCEVYVSLPTGISLTYALVQLFRSISFSKHLNV
nr:MAG TPA: hypothetical protein [Caudoviricetes sp.]